MLGLPGLRRLASGIAVVGVVVAATACDPPPEPSDHVEVTYLDVPDDEFVGEQMEVNERGDFVACHGEECYLWRDGDISVMSTDGSAVFLEDFSNEGHVTGDLGDGGGESPFVWHDGVMTILPQGQADHTLATGVNDRGVVVGLAVYDDWSYQEVVVWRNGEMVTMPPGDWQLSTGGAINNNNQVAVELIHTSDPEHPADPPEWDLQESAIWDLGTGEVTRLGTLGGGDDVPADINDRGMVIGYSDITDDERHPFLWHNGEMIGLGTLGGDWGVPSVLNEWGQVVGRSTDAQGDLQPFLWYEGEMTVLDGLDAASVTDFRPMDINNWGQVVGYGRNADGDWRHYLWQNGRVADLGQFAKEADSWVVISSVGSLFPAINDRGQTMAMGRNEDGDFPVRWEVSPTWGYYPDGLP